MRAATFVCGLLGGALACAHGASAEAAPTGPPERIDWPTLRALVLAESPEVAAKAARVDVAASERLFAEQSPNPTLDVGVAVHVAGADTFDTAQPTVGLSQPIRLVRKAAARRVAADASVDVAKAEADVFAHDLLIAARRALTALQRAEARATTTAALVDEVKALERIVDERVKAGAASDYEEHKLAREVALVTADAEAAAIDLGAASHALATLIGIPGWQPRAADALAPVGVNAPPDEALARSLAAHPALLENHAEDVLALARRDAAERERWPDLVLSGGVQGTVDRFGVAPFIGLSIDLMTFDKGKDQIARARAESVAARRDADALRAELAAQIAAATALVADKKSALQRWDQTISADADALARQSRDAYRAGKTDLLDLLDTLRGNADARLRRIDLVADIVAAETDLLDALGRVDP